MKNKHKHSSGYDPKNTLPQNTVGGREVSTRCANRMPFVHDPFTGERSKYHNGMYVVYMGAVKPTNAVLVNINGLWFKAKPYWANAKREKRISSCLPKGVETKLLHPEEAMGLVEHGYERLVHRTLTGEKLDPNDASSSQWWGSRTGRIAGAGSAWAKSVQLAQSYGAGKTKLLQAILPTTKEK